MSNCILHIRTDNNLETVDCTAGTTIIEAMGGIHRSHLESPCGGKGTCGKCLVLVEGNGVSEISDIEEKKLTETEIEKGYRLACVAKITGEVTVTLPSKTDGIVILEEGLEFREHLDPCVRKKHITLTTPDLDDQRDDLRRLKDELQLPEHHLPLDQLTLLPETLRNNEYSVTASYNDISLLTVEGGDTEHLNYGLAIDIGTTTVVVYLLDMNTGKKIGVTSGLNVQKSYGQDVISRINHTMTDKTGLTTLHTGIIRQLNEMINKLSAEHTINKNHIYSMTIAGNTTMMHLAAGIPPVNIAAAPFIPAGLETMRVTAAEMGLSIHKNGMVYILPGISAYVGADITAAALASGMAMDDRLSVLIDIGTNGEIMMGNKDRLLSCSTAAGPAFEGASIHDGVGGVAGAIDAVRIVDGALTYTTIAGAKPIGICGSGIVDTISNLVYEGIIDQTGRMVDENEIGNNADQAVTKNLTEFNGQKAYMLVESAHTDHGDSIILTQKDVREIQNAKASIAAGITTLIKKAEKTFDDIETVYLAGGFGSYIDKHHAAHLGLIPGELENKIEVIGNAAGSGAIMALLSKDKYRACSQIAARTEYVELSSSPEFMDDYMNGMMFS